ncbi:MAG: POTRA domain-containing protein [Pseudomonadota bacterium]
MFTKQVMAGCVVALFAAGAWGQESAAPHFEIIRFVIEGSSLLKSEEAQRSVAPYAGKDKSFADVQYALEALQAAYRAVGYDAVQVILPEQTLEQGVVRFRVIEGRIAKVRIEGNRHHDTDNVRNSIPGLIEGEAPRSRRVAASLRVANENPSKQTSLLLKDGEKEGDIDATFKLTDEKPQKTFITLDNSGTSQTGRFRLGAGYQNANLFNRDHVATVQYITSPENPSRVTVLGMGYRIPLYARGDSIDVVAGYSDVDSGTVQDLFNVSGSGSILGVRYNQYLPRLGENYDQKVGYGLDYRAYQNRVVLAVGGGSSLVPDITVHPFSLTYTGGWRSTGNEVGFYLGAAQNIPGGNAGTSADFSASRTNATASYRIYRYGATLAHSFLSDWQVRAQVHGQDTRDALVSGEQFGVGGADNVRGFLEREFAEDRGHRGSVEIYSPDFGDAISSVNLKLRALVFADAADTKRTDPLPGEIAGQSVSSCGIGFRLGVGSSFSARADFAMVLDGTNARTSGSKVAHVSLAYIF